MSVKSESILAAVAAIVLFAAGFFLGPLQFSDYFQKIPGDLGDARLNAYFLENIYQYLLGNVDSLWHFGFYYPFPYVIGFSDNLFGLSPLFMLFRSVGVDAYSSFLYWFMTGYALNFVACLYALRKMELSVWAAILGALIFTYGLPVTGHAGHAQLHHRFGMPLVLCFYIQFLRSRDIRDLLVSYFWLVWQFLTGVYIGFFATLMLIAMTICYLAFPYARGRVALSGVWSDLWSKYKSIDRPSLIKILASFALLSVAMVWLFYPYLQVKSLYGFERSWGEIRGMLPRIYSYIYAPSSTLWDFKLSVFNKLPMRWEHQMFPGMVPFVLGLIGLVAGFTRRSSLAFKLFSCGFLFLFCMTLNTGSAWWKYVYQLPLFSAIRAMSRIDLLYLLIYGFLSAYVLDTFVRRKPIRVAACLLLSAFFVYESGEMRTHWNKKSRWELKEAELTKVLPKDRPEGAALFIAQMSKPWYEHEVTSMWLGLKHSFKTVNGYSGNGPAGYNNQYGKDCSELKNRLAIYDKFAENNGLRLKSQQIASNILPVGFSNCP